MEITYLNFLIFALVTADINNIEKETLSMWAMKSVTLLILYSEVKWAF